MRPRTGELVARSLRGDGRAFAGLAAGHEARARATAFAVLGDWHEAEDVAQEALLRAYLGLGRLLEPAAFGAWLAGIALNVARSRARRRDWVSLGEVSGGRSVFAAAPSRDDELELAEVRAAVAAGLAALPAGQAEVLRLHYVDDLPVRAIAARLGRSEGAVRVRLHRARVALRGRLGEFSAGTVRKERREMVDVVVEDVLAKPAEDMRVVLLREAGGERLLPIWIGAADGYGFAFALAGEPPPRPMAGDLLARLVEALGGRVVRVVVSRVVDDTFHADLVVAGAGGERAIDARPSDALALALRVGAPMHVDAELMDRVALHPAALAAHFDAHSPAEGKWQPLSAELAASLHGRWKPAKLPPTERP